MSRVKLLTQDGKLFSNGTSLLAAELESTGGSVEDVKVNGTSVVDGDGVANIVMNDPTSAINTHNTSTEAHQYIRNLISGKYSKPTNGIPASDLAESYYLSSNPSGYQTSTQVTTSISSHNTSNSAHTDIRNAIPSVVDNVTSTSTTSALSAKQGKELNDRINDLQNIGRFLALWDCSTGLPTTDPTSLPYTYHTGDYFRVASIDEDTNYKPNGAQYTGDASTTIEYGDVQPGDIYFYDGTEWSLQINHGGGGGGPANVNYTTGAADPTASPEDYATKLNVYLNLTTHAFFLYDGEKWQGVNTYQ